MSRVLVVLLLVLSILGVPALASAHGVPCDIDATESTWHVKQLIRCLADREGMNPQYPLVIAECESNFRIRAFNASSGASGIFQQLQKFWDARAKRFGYEGADVFDPRANIHVSIRMAKEYGWKHWSCMKDLDQIGRLSGMNVRFRELPWHTHDWPYGPPIGVLLHFTAGCGDPHSVLLSRHASVHGGVLRPEDGGYTDQYVTLNDYGYHAYEASRRFFGIETVAMPGICDVTVGQLQRLARLTAFLAEHAEQVWKVNIPTRRSPGCEFVPGIKFHSDGLEPGCDWDPNRHWDSPLKASGDPTSAWVGENLTRLLDRSPWSWEHFQKRVRWFRRHVFDPPPVLGTHPHYINGFGFQEGQQ